MRGSDKTSGSLFSYVGLEDRVPAGHPLRVILEIVNDALADLDADFTRLYEGRGRASIAPERLLRASLLQAFYSIRSERQLIDYNLLFRWFVGLGIDDPVWDHSTFSKNRDRLLEADVAASWTPAKTRWISRSLLRIAQSSPFPSPDRGDPGCSTSLSTGSGRTHPTAARRSWKIRRSKL